MTSEPPLQPPLLPKNAHKGSAGRVLCVAGSESMPGAALLTARGAQLAGAGLVTLAAFEKAMIWAVASAAPETVFVDLSRSKNLVAGRLPGELCGRRDDVRVAGPGLGQSSRAQELVRGLISDDFDGPLVLDADALNVMQATPEALAEYGGNLVLTPHPGEAARLLAESKISQTDEGRIEAAKSIARVSAGVCVLKGFHTVVTDGARCYVNASGNPGMATAGSGDVLTGMIGAYLARSCQLAEGAWDEFNAICSAVYTHGLAGDLAAMKLGERAVTASGILKFISSAQLELERGAVRSGD